MTAPGQITTTDTTGREDEAWNASLGPDDLSLVLAPSTEPLSLKTLGELIKTFARIIELTGDDAGVSCTAYLGGMGFDDDGTMRIKATVGPKQKRRRKATKR